MALVGDDGGDAGSNVVPGERSSSLAYTLPSGVAQYVESVVVSVDNTSGGDLHPTVIVRDSSGQVISAKRQDDVIPAGESDGLAVWSLRLAGSSSSALSHPIGFYTVAPNAGNPVAAGDPDPLLKFTFAGVQAGVDLLDTTIHGSPNGPTAKVAGLYALGLRVGLDPDPIGPFPAGKYASLDLFEQNAPPPESFWSAQLTQLIPLDNTFASECLVSLTMIRYLDPNANGAGAANYFQAILRRTPGQSLNVGGVLAVQRIY